MGKTRKYADMKIMVLYQDSADINYSITHPESEDRRGQYSASTFCLAHVTGPHLLTSWEGLASKNSVISRKAYHIKIAYSVQTDN